MRRVPSLSHWGAFTALVEGDRVVGVEPFAGDPDPSPILAGIPDAVHSPLRIARPAVRRGWLERRDRTRDGSDAFVDISWDDALNLVAGELTATRARRGPEGIFCGSYGWSAAGRLHHARSVVRRLCYLAGGAVDQSSNYSWGAGEGLLQRVIGTAAPVNGAGTDWASVIAHTRLIVAFGGLATRNAQVTSGGALTHRLPGWIARAQAAGIRLISLTPIGRDTPEGTEHIAIRPGTDACLILAILRLLVTSDRADCAFLERYTVGWEALRASILVDQYTPDAAAAVTGVPAATIQGLADALYFNRSLMTLSWSLQRAEAGEQPYWAAIALAAALGQIGLPGGGFGFGHGSIGGAGEPRLAIPGPDFALPQNRSGLTIPAARIADMLLHPGEAYRWRGEDHRFPAVDLVYWAGGNPFHHHQDLGRLARAWTKPQTIVVQEPWWTPTARRADIVLPASTVLERNDIGGSSRDPAVIAMHQAIPPVGEARGDFTIGQAIADRLGYGAAFGEGLDEMGWCQRLYDRFVAASRLDLPAFAAFWQQGHITLPTPATPAVLFDQFRRDPERYPLATPSGRIELGAEADLGHRPHWRAPTETGPLLLLTPQPRLRLHAQIDFAGPSVAGKIAGREPVLIHPDDAAKRGIADGDIVRLYNARGACLAGAVLAPDILPGVVALATGAWYDPDEGGLDRHGNPNVLTRDVGSSAFTQGCSAQTCAVDVERWTGTVPPITAHTPPRVIGG